MPTTVTLRGRQYPLIELDSAPLSMRVHHRAFLAVVGQYRGAPPHDVALMMGVAALGLFTRRLVDVPFAPPVTSYGHAVYSVLLESYEDDVDLGIKEIEAAAIIAYGHILGLQPQEIATQAGVKAAEGFSEPTPAGPS
jgi:hypothetical protein